MRRRIYEILTNPRPDDRLGRAIGLGILLLIAASVTTSVLRTDAEILASAPRFFETFELISIVVFTIEYMLRLWSCTVDPRFARPIRGRIKQALRPLTLVDLVSIAPFYIELLVPGFLDLRFLRVLRLLRVFRLLHIGPFGGAFARIVRVVQKKRTELGISLALVVVAMVLAAGGMYLVEHNEPNTQFTSIPRAMWWSIVTITTVGYGDMTPATPLGQLIAGAVAFVGICALALPVGIISSGYLDEINAEKRDVVSCPHCGKPLAEPEL